MSDDGAVAGRAFADSPIVVSAALACDDPVRVVAERRLKYISDALGLDTDHFERAYEVGRRALDGSRDDVNADQLRRVTAVFPEIDDPLVRQRLVELVAALATVKDG